MNVKPLNMQHFTASGGMKVLLLPLIFLLHNTAFSQSYGEIGIFGGGSYYVGDLNPGKHFLMTKPAFGGFARHNFNERLAVKLSATYGQIKGDDKVSGYYPDRMLNFSSSVTDLSATFEINFFEYFIGSLRHYFTPYMFGGAGMVMFNPKGRYDGNSYELQPLGTEGQGTELYPDREPYNRMAFHIPFGIGMKYSLNDYIGISLHWSLQKTYTDYLDDVSTTYYLDLKDSNPGEVSIERLLSDPSLSHSNGMQRGNSQNNDWYSFAGISISLKVNYFNNKKCLNTFL
jgi:hypothetical protein